MLLTFALPTPTAAPAPQRLETLVQEVEPDIYTPDFVAEEVRPGLQAIPATSHPFTSECTWISVVRNSISRPS